MHQVILMGKGESYVLRSRSVGPPFYIQAEKAPGNFQAFLRRFKESIVHCAFRAGPIDLREAMDSKDLTIRDVSRITSNGESVIRLAIDYDRTYETPTRSGRGPAVGKRKVHISGIVSLDPGRAWAVRDFELHTTTDGDPQKTSDAVGSVVYSTGPEIPFPTEITSETRHSHGQNERIAFKVDRWVYDSPPPREFTLAFYGLGDYFVGRSNWLGRYGITVWAAGAAILAFTLSFVFKWLGRPRGNH
ncbi:MAG: hypothetical protein ACP5XB_19675 [Isosphaeraceae bacterium]